MKNKNKNKALSRALAVVNLRYPQSLYTYAVLNHTSRMTHFPSVPGAPRHLCCSYVPVSTGLPPVALEWDGPKNLQTLYKTFRVQWLKSFILSITGLSRFLRLSIQLRVLKKYFKTFKLSGSKDSKGPSFPVPDQRASKFSGVFKGFKFFQGFSRLMGFLCSKGFLSCFRKFSWEGNRTSYTSLYTLIYTSK